MVGHKAYNATAFAHLRGQKQARLLLGRSLASDRLAHAYLFRGPDGVGKQLFARSLAAAVNCRQTEGLEACGICPSCKKFRSGNHPDFHVISPEKGTIKIDRIRELIRLLSYAPYESGMRVVLLEDIHTMRQEAANSLLKTLEEPPADNLLILTAETTRDLLGTISSRCQTIPFYSLNQEDTVAILREQVPELDEKAARLLARLSEGRPGQALLLHKSDIVTTWQELTTLLNDSPLDPARDVGHLLRGAEKMATLKEELPSLLGLLRLWIRDLLAGSCQERDTPPTNGTLSKSWNFNQLFAKLQAINRAEQELARNCNRALVCEVLLFKLQA
jgi:DNA polymerase-3 subunit delta'